MVIVQFRCRLVRQYRACVIDSLGLGIICVLYHCTMCTRHLLCFLCIKSRGDSTSTFSFVHLLVYIRTPAALTHYLCLALPKRFFLCHVNAYAAHYMSHHTYSYMYVYIGTPAALYCLFLPCQKDVNVSSLLLWLHGAIFQEINSIMELCT